MTVKKSMMQIEMSLKLKHEVKDIEDIEIRFTSR
jgi:hypothetical protein